MDTGGTSTSTGGNVSSLSSFPEVESVLDVDSQAREVFKRADLRAL